MDFGMIGEDVLYHVSEPVGLRPATVIAEREGGRADLSVLVRPGERTPGAPAGDRSTVRYVPSAPRARSGTVAVGEWAPREDVRTTSRARDASSSETSGAAQGSSGSDDDSVLSRSALQTMKKRDLQKLAEDEGIESKGLTKNQIVDALLAAPEEK